MKKHLILVLALALVAGLTVGAYAEVQNVKVSGDITVLGLGRQLSLTSQKAETTMASITRLRVDADLTDNVIATVRLINERYWGTNGNATTSVTPATSSENTAIDLDLAYVTLKEFLYSPLTLTVGRQELHFGNDMIIGDAYTNNQASKDSAFNTTIDKDLSMRKSFDSIRATLNYDPLVIDVVAAQVKQNYRTQPNSANATTSLSIDDQETLIGMNANYAISKTMDVEGYFWQKRIGKDNKQTVTTIAKTDYTNVAGARIVAKPMDILTYQLESAFQFGEATTTTGTLDRRAWALETMATLDLRNIKAITKYKPMASVLFAYFSGDRGKNSGSKTYGGWDPMYENQTFGNIANTLINQTNMYVAGGNLTAKPVDDVTLKGEYYTYWWDKRVSGAGNAVATGESLTFTGKKFIGQELDLTATYDYTEDVQFGLLGGWFITGSSFAGANKNTAGEVIGSMKVTF